MVDNESESDKNFKNMNLNESNMLQDILQKIFVSSTKNNSTQENNATCSQTKNDNVNNKNDSQITDAAKKYFYCRICKKAFPKSGTAAHRKQHHSDLPKYKKLHEAIGIESTSKTVNDSKIIEGNKDTRKRHILDEKSQVLTKSKADEQKSSDNQDERGKKTPKKRKVNEKADHEKPPIFQCNRCSLNFVSAETIEKHFKECQTLSRHDSRTCVVCGLNFTQDELIIHLEKHAIHKYNKFYILVVSNATLAENNNGISKETVSPSTSTNIRKSSKDELAKKRNSGQALRQDLNKESNVNIDGTRMTGKQKQAYTTIANNTHTEIEILREEENVLKLFKCNECNVHFLTSSSCNKHMKNHKFKDPAKCFKCSDCGFVFSNYSSGKHKYDCPVRNNYDKVIVEERRIVIQDDKVVKEVHQVQYNIQRQCNRDDNSMNTPGIVNSEITVSDGKPLNADKSLFDSANNVVEKNMNVTNIDNRLGQINDERGKRKTQNFIKDAESQSDFLQILSEFKHFINNNKHT